MKSLFVYITALLLTAWFAGTGCEGEATEESAVIQDTKPEEIPKTNIVKFNGRLFNIPSPIQVSELVRSTQMPYNEKLPNPSGNYQNYSGSFKQALNLGVYGADLAYINLYEKYNTAADYYEVVKKLSQELNIDNSFTDDVLNKIEDNKKNKDSLLYITSKAYKNADNYLIQNERNDISILILAGGWIESLYILTQSMPSEQNQNIINRIGQQKYALDNLIELMRPYYNKKSAEYDQLLLELSDLALIFDGVVIKYEYQSPVTDKEKKLTVIKSKSQIEINEYQLKNISENISKIRSSIIN